MQQKGSPGLRGKRKSLSFSLIELKKNQIKTRAKPNKNDKHYQKPRRYTRQEKLSKEEGKDSDQISMSQKPTALKSFK